MPVLNLSSTEEGGRGLFFPSLCARKLCPTTRFECTEQVRRNAAQIEHSGAPLFYFEISKAASSLLRNPNFFSLR